MTFYNVVKPDRNLFLPKTTLYIDFFPSFLQVLFEEKQWDFLADQFKQEFCKLYGMTLEPLLNIYLQAGLSALKTPYPYFVITYMFSVYSKMSILNLKLMLLMTETDLPLLIHVLLPLLEFLLTLTWLRFCYEDDCTKEDPLSQEAFRKLAQPLPYSKQHHSRLVCYITKELMDTENLPLVLPNGYVYSTKVCSDNQTIGKTLIFLGYFMLQILIWRTNNTMFSFFVI